MENSWQNICGSTLHSSAPCVASSSSKEFRLETGMNMGPCFHSNDPKEARAKLLGRVQHSLCASNSNLTSNRMDHVNHGSSFLGLLSAPPSLLQCDLQELSNLKPNYTHGLLTRDINSAVVDAAVSAIPLTFRGQPSENQSDVKVQNHNLIADTFSYNSSRAVSSSNACSDSVLPDLHSSELGKMVIHHLVSGTDKVKGSLSLGSDLQVTGTEIAGKQHGTKFQPTQTCSAQANSSTNLSSDILSCPRVFCLSKEGYLLISNTGLLGIVCFCHFLHMSVSKFCEHAGVCGVNPGNVVRMDSGETIAQWCRIYFQKFGIRVSEDHSDWDWAEGLSAHAGLKKSGVTKSNVSCNFSHLIHSSENLLRSGQLLENVASKNFHTDQNSVNGAFQNKQKRTIHDRNNEVLQGLIGTYQSSMHAMAAKHMLNCPQSQCSAVPNFIGSGPQNCSTSNTVHIDSVLNLINSSVVQPAFQKLCNYRKEHNFSMNSDADDSLLYSRDVVSSNIELKLGQPYQSSQHSGNLEILAMRQQSMKSLGNPRMSLFPKQTVHNVGCREKVEHGQSLCFASSSRSMGSRGEHDQTNIRNNAFGIQGVNSSAKLLNYGGKLGQNSVNSSLINFNNSHENSMPRRSIGNTLNNLEVSMPYLQHSVPPFAAYDIHNAAKDSDNAVEQPSNRFDCGSPVLDDKGKGVGSATNRCCILKDSGFRPCKELESDSGLDFSEAHKESCQSHQLSNIPLDALDSGRYLSFGTNVQATFFNHKSLASPIGSGSTLNFPAHRVSNAASCLLDQSPTLFREDGVSVGSCLLNDNFRLLAMRQTQELSKLQQSVCSIANEEEVRSRDVSYLQHSLGETSTHNEHFCRPDFTSGREVTETTAKTSQCGSTCRFLCNKGISGCCSGFSTLTRGIAGQSLFSDNISQKKQPAMRCDKNNAGQGKCENCCIGKPCSCFGWNSNSPIHINCLGRSSDPIIGSLPTSFNEQTGVLSGEVSMKSNSIFAENHSVGHSKIISSDQGGKLNGPITKSICAQASQWKDVPSKSRGFVDVKHLDSSACILDVKGYVGSQHGDNSSKCFNETVQTMNSFKETVQTLNSFKEHDVSNFSSGCSAPAVTHVSPEFNDMDSSSAHAGNSGCVSNVVDEESRIDKNWSSDDARGSGRSSDFSGATCKTSFKKCRSSKNSDHQSSRSLLEELKLINSLTWKKRTEVQAGLAVQSNDAFSQKLGRSLKTGKRKRYRSALVHHGNPKNITTAELSSCSWNSIQILSPSSQGKTQVASFSKHNSKRRLSILSSAKKLPRKRDLDELYEDTDRKDVCLTKLNASFDGCGIPDVSSGNKSKGDYTSQFRKNQLPEPLHEGSLKNKCISLACERKSRPRVYGKYGELSDGKLVDDMLKPAKIVSLSRVLKYARRCALPKVRPISSVKDFRKMSHERYCGESYLFKTEKGSKSCGVTFCSKVSRGSFLEKMSKECSNRDNEFAEESSMVEEERHYKSDKDNGKLESITCSQWKPKCKNVQKRCIYELTVTGSGPHSRSFFPSKSSKCSPEVKDGRPLCNDEDGKPVPNIIAEKLPKMMYSSILDSDAFCCVCSSSNKDEINCLLQCSQCLIKVHQACYGVPRVPKGHWYCRPCRTNSKDTVCVLCGYGGGAMTRALRSLIIVKSLLRSWNIETENKLKNKVSSTGTQQSQLTCAYSCPSELRDSSFPVFRTVNHGTLDSAVHNVDMSYQHDVLEKPPCRTKFKVQNSIMAGLLDPTIKQWVHMVCALWTPGTRCPNVDTMGAFDVSGASHPKASVICSICGRSGGSCIRCRVVNCFIQFHPWCAHQKNLLQIEEVENDKVAFYGRCAHHAAQLMCETGCNHSVVKTDLVVEEFTCARTEGFKGRKHDDFRYNQHSQSKGKGGCLVPQDQLNAWIHINGQKSCIQGLGIKPISDTEYDGRKEYVRYKQAKGWKHLIVYKSDIHALGLYTSRFISRGEMVVEYVGEIVGQRVADKREHEYQCGRRLQYKSACYFFRIDKEHIIDATCKGGIARFVNHSCLPNCVAKVISVRNENKVVFFAERDIFPGEEITYDYHFNHEDEGKKIPCFCNSNNCRRYMN